MGVFVKVNDVEIEEWQKVGITDSIKNIADSFDITSPNTPDPNGIYLPINPFDFVELFEDDELLLTGWCDTLSATISAIKNNLTASGRSKAGQLIDCSAEVEGGMIRNSNALKICQAIAKPFEIPFTLAAGVDVGAIFPKHSMKFGEAAFAAMNRALQARQLLPSTLPTGAVELIKSKSKVAEDPLVVGVNCKLSSGKFSGKDRFSKYTVVGQGPAFRRTKTPTTTESTDIASIGSAAPGSQTTIKKRDPQKTSRPRAFAEDSGVPLYRPKLIQASKRLDNSEAKDMALWEATHRDGKSRGISVTLPAWRQRSGTPWASNMLVMVTIPQFNLVDEEMLIESRQLVYSVKGGKSLVLILVGPDTYTQQPQKTTDIQKGRKKSNSGTQIASIGKLNPGEIIKKGGQ